MFLGDLLPRLAIHVPIDDGLGGKEAHQLGKLLLCR